MINNLFKIIGLIFGAIGAGFLIGKKNEKNKQDARRNKNSLKVIKRTKEIEKKVSSMSLDDKRKRLRKYARK